MLVHENRKYRDEKHRPYSFTKRILHNYYEDECEIFLVSGMPEGIGKSAYVSHVQADVYGYQACKDREACSWLKSSVKPQDRPEDAPFWSSDWETVKVYTEYLPIEVVKRCINMLERGIRDPCLHFDDGGTWLNAMEYHDPFVIAFMEYASLARSNWGAIIISTPVEEWVLKKLHTATGVIRIRITKAEGTGPRNIFKKRYAKAFRVVRMPNRVRPYWRSEFNDMFVQIMPDDFYEWYRPRRDRYALMAAKKMERAILKKKSVEEHIADSRDPATELKEIIKQVG